MADPVPDRPLHRGAGASQVAPSLAITGFAEWERFWPIWLTWWLGDVVGALVVAPILIVWGRAWPWQWGGAVGGALEVSARLSGGPVVDCDTP